MNSSATFAVPCTTADEHCPLIALQDAGAAAGAALALEARMDDGADAYLLEDEIFNLVRSIAGESGAHGALRDFILPMIGRKLASLHEGTDRTGLKWRLSEIAEVAASLSAYIPDDLGA